jgi:hypothetical protein
MDIPLKRAAHGRIHSLTVFISALLHCVRFNAIHISGKLALNLGEVERPVLQ